MSRVIAYLTSDGDKHYLNVMGTGNTFHQFEVDSRTLARLNVEAAERLLLEVRGTYATRMNAPVLASEGPIG